MTMIAGFQQRHKNEVFGAMCLSEMERSTIWKIFLLYPKRDPAAFKN
jgi:hypothetical protein